MSREDRKRRLEASLKNNSTRSMNNQSQKGGLKFPKRRPYRKKLGSNCLFQLSCHLINREIAIHHGQLIAIAIKLNQGFSLLVIDL